MGKILFVALLPTSKSRLTELLDETINLTELFNWSAWPLGILSIQSYARKMCPDLDSEIIDLNRSFLDRISAWGNYSDGIRDFIDHYVDYLMEDISRALKKGDVEVCALSALFDISLSTLELLAGEIKKIAPGVLVVAGGFPCTNFADAIIERNDAIDAISLGEGEIPFAELMMAEDKRAYLGRSPYFVSRGNRGRTYGFVEDINDVPMVDYDGYLAKYGEGALHAYVNVLKGGKASLGAEGVVMTSRGCPCMCVFCAAHSIHGRRMRYLTVERVKAEIDFWIDTHDVATINIIDDNFLGDVDRAIEIIDYVRGRGRDIIFSNTLSFLYITEKFIECLKRNGITEVHLALESGSDRVLRDVMRKPITLKHVDRVLDMLDEAGIFVKIALLVGFPEETPEDVDAALAYLRTAKFHWATISNLIPISGSETYERIVRDGGVEYNTDRANVFVSGYANPRTVEHMLGDIKYTMNLDINFVHNRCLRLGEYDRALGIFESIARNYPDHAFAHYYLAQCQERLGRRDKAEKSRAEYRRIIAEQPFWKKYALHFGLEGA